MNRTTAIVATVITSLACGIPSVVLLCFGVLALMGTQMPEVMAQNPDAAPGDVMMGAGMFLCLGAVLLIIPILVGVFSFRLSKKEDTGVIDYIPPAS
jgi:hypothetical protein